MTNIWDLLEIELPTETHNDVHKPLEILCLSTLFSLLPVANVPLPLGILCHYDITILKDRSQMSPKFFPKFSPVSTLSPFDKTHFPGWRHLYNNNWVGSIKSEQQRILASDYILFIKPTRNLSEVYVLNIILGHSINNE